MKIDQFKMSSDGNIVYEQNNIIDKNLTQIVLVFGDRFEFEKYDWLSKIKNIYPKANIISSTSSGDISDINVSTNLLIVTSIFLEKTEYRIAKTNNLSNEFSRKAGVDLASQFTQDNLKHILLLSDGQKVNGSELIEGMSLILPSEVFITGGLAGDSARFEKTFVGLDNDIKEGNIIAIGFYGDSIKIGYGSRGGWDPFGPIRIITKSDNNVLYEFDNENALDLYKLYLGERAKDLPASSLLFPLGVFSKENGQILVRTVLSINEEEKTMTFAGDLPEGSKVQLMKANFENLIDGASDAAKNALFIQNEISPDLAILVSCVGRKLVLGQRIEEELEAIQDVFGNKTVLAGFYSYGEICPILKGYSANLQNQTMTITTFTEI